MSIKVRIPTPLQSITKNKSEVEVEKAQDIKDLIEKLEEEYPGIKERLLDENGNLRRFINFFVNEEDIRFLDGINTVLKDGDEVSIIPAIAGGSLANVQCSTFNGKWFNFQKLKVYNNAIEFVSDIYILTKKFPKEELYGIVNQIRRASISISLNIAEGSSSSKTEFRRYIRMARGSIYECVSLLEISLKLKYISVDEYKNYYQKCASLSQMISALIKSLNIEH
jgi:molybdopterin synthase sulfur carrier subunit